MSETLIPSDVFVICRYISWLCSSFECVLKKKKVPFPLRIGKAGRELRKILVRAVGFEPTRITPLDPKSSVSAISPRPQVLIIIIADYFG